MEYFFLIFPERTESEFNNFNVGTVNAVEKKFT